MMSWLYIMETNGYHRKKSIHTLYQVMLVEASIMLSPCQPEMGTKATAAGL